VRRDQVGEAARGDRRRLGFELPADPGDDLVHLAREAVDQTGLESGRRRLADHRGRRGEVDPEEPSCTGEERIHRDLDPRCEDPSDVLTV
jgi:hypothetical protein